MAKMTIKSSGVDASVSSLGVHFSDTARAAVAAGAGVLADAVRQRLEALPSDENRFLVPGDIFRGVPKEQKQDLLDALGVTPIKQDANLVYNAAVGFDGYGSTPTKTYPQGVPNQLLARSIESGSSVRIKTPFFRKAMEASEDAVLEAMQAEINKLLET